MTTPLFPGGVAASRLRVYDWPDADGVPGGSPHLHTASGALPSRGVGGMGVGALTTIAPDTATDAARVGVRYGGVVFDGGLVAEHIHARGADVLARFADGLAEGGPALTRHRHGAGGAWYVATHPDAAGIDAIVAAVVAGAGIRPVVENLPAGVEAARRGDLVTVINHTDAPVSVDIEGTDAETGAAVDHLELDPQQVAFIRVAVTRPETEQAIAPAEGLSVPVA